MGTVHWRLSHEKRRSVLCLIIGKKGKSLISRRLQWGIITMVFNSSLQVTYRYFMCYKIMTRPLSSGQSAGHIRWTHPPDCRADSPVLCPTYHVRRTYTTDIPRTSGVRSQGAGADRPGRHLCRGGKMGVCMAENFFFREFRVTVLNLWSVIK
jgi:hypothetical protein